MATLTCEVVGCNAPTCVFSDGWRSLFCIKHDPPIFNELVKFRTWLNGTPMPGFYEDRPLDKPVRSLGAFDVDRALLEHGAL